MRLAFAIFGLVSTLTAVSTAKFDQFSKECGVSLETKARIFAAPDRKHWNEYTSINNIPEPNIDWSEGAFVLRNGNIVATEIDGVGQDFSDSSFYCFDKKGKLARIEREFATAWGWGYGETNSFKNGSLSAHQEHYFDTKTHAAIPRPAGYDDVHDAMKLRVYKSIQELPFFKLI